MNKMSINTKRLLLLQLTTTILLLLVLHHPTTTLADLPSHCLKSDVIGTWNVKLTDFPGLSNQQLCGHTVPDDIIAIVNSPDSNSYSTFPSSTTTLIGTFTLRDLYSSNATLCLPSSPETDNVLICEDAFWTMVYDEAFFIHGRETKTDLLLDFRYEPIIQNASPKDAKQWNSRCDQTYPGWWKRQNSHGCAIAQNQQPIPPHSSQPGYNSNSGGSGSGEQESFTTNSGTQFSLSSLIKQRLQHGNKKQQITRTSNHRIETASTVNRINSQQQTWTASSEWITQTLRENNAQSIHSYSFDDVVRHLGGNRNKILKPKSLSLDDIVNPVERENEALRRSCIDKVLPTELDWSLEPNVTTPINNQGSCGSCYAVSSADAMSMRYRLLQRSRRGGGGGGGNSDNSVPEPFSALNVLQCSVTNQGCDGGFPWLVGYHANTHGMVPDTCAGGPYTDRVQASSEFPSVCNGDDDNSSNCPNRVFAKRWGYVGGFYGRGNAQDMAWSLARDGPLVVAINAGQYFVLYKNGLFQSPETLPQDLVKQRETYWELTTHAVTLVGYGQMSVPINQTHSEIINTWKIKNSWGENWGENGYFTLQRGADAIAVESMPVHVLFDDKPGNGNFEQDVRAKLATIDDTRCIPIIEQMLREGVR
jgi:hypothetical protein